MTPIEARKALATRKVKENYMAIKFEVDWQTRLLLPYGQGLAFMAALGNAEEIREKYNEPKRILPMNLTAITTQIMSSQDYDSIRMAIMLNIPVDEVKEMMEQAA